MVTLLDGKTVLKMSPILGNRIQYVYRLALDDSGYTVHVETREPNGSCGEMFLYQGQSLTTANYVYNRYAQ